MTTYAYDLADRLSSVTRQVGQNPAMTLGAYWYDGVGQRTKKQEGSSIISYYFGLGLHYSEDGSGQRLEENIMDTNGIVFTTKRFSGVYSITS